MKIESKFNGERLREARRYRGLTITELADKLNVTKQMISKYENNKSAPPLESSFILMKELGFPREFFYSADLFTYKDEGTYFRSHLTAIQKEKEPTTYDKKYIAIIRDFLGQYVDFPEDDTYIDFEDFSVEECAMELRKKWGIFDEPISNMMRLMEEKGFVISITQNDYDKLDASGGIAEVNNYCYKIVMIEGENCSFYRQQFSLAHELGHWVIDYGTGDPQELSKEAYKEMEKRSNSFASNFLLPKQAFIYSTKNLDLSSLESYLVLKKLWFVSLGTLVMRTRSLNLITADEYIKLQKQINYRKWKRTEPYDDTKLIMKPIALKQAIELLVDNNIIEPQQIATNIYKKYGMLLPVDMIEKICCLKRGYLSSHNMPSINLKPIAMDG